MSELKTKGWNGYHYLEELGKDNKDVFSNIIADLDAVLLDDDLEVVLDSCHLQVEHRLRLQLKDVRFQLFRFGRALDEDLVGCFNQLDPVL